MKYIITESKLNNIVFKYLDSLNYLIIDNGKKYNNYIYFLNDESDVRAQISVYHKNAFGEIRNWVYVDSDLINLINQFIPIQKSQLPKVIGRWVGDKLGLDIPSDEVYNTAYGDMNHRLIIK